MFDMHTISDVPVAYILSGGIDSSLIAGVSTKIKNFDKMAKFLVSDQIKPLMRLFG